MSGLIAEAKAIAVLEACRRHGILLATAESCTGGLIAASLTDIGGSSDVVDRGFVTYSNEAKQEMIGVPAELIAKHGAVSEEVALAMATGALAHSTRRHCGFGNRYRRTRWRLRRQAHRTCLVWVGPERQTTGRSAPPVC